MKSSGNNFNYFPENKRTKLTKFGQFIRMLMFYLEDWGLGPPAPLPPFGYPTAKIKNMFFGVGLSRGYTGPIVRVPASRLHCPGTRSFSGQLSQSNFIKLNV